MDEHAISFGSFRLLLSQRLLLEGDRPVRLGSRALDILAVLAENAGRVVPKEELIARVWPKVFVEESSLKIQVSALRRALGDGQGGNRYIVTVPGRGYEFVVPVGLTAEPAAMPVPAVPQPGTHNLPLAMTRMIGREEAVAVIVSRVSRQRLVTVVGPGGIGKTTVALAVAERMIADYEDGVWLVDLAPLGDSRLVPSAVATVLGLEVRTDSPLPGLIAGLRDKRTLLLLDNCEHVIDAAASLAAAVLTGVPRVNILATSREPLGVAGEREHRLGPLGSPPTSSGLKAAEAATFHAVQLFVERVAAIVEDFALTDANAPLIVEICQKLDGLPLAIEFAAPRVAVLGVEGLATGLDRSLPLLTARRRATTARHQTMRAVVDWSYGLLSEDEQVFLRALGIFAGGFTVEAAAAVALDPATTHIDAIDRLADLVANSLVVADVSGARPRFRLLDATRAYAIERLDENSERKQVAYRHAEHYRDVFERAEGEAAARPTGEWLADYGREIDNLRGALDWAFSPAGDGSIGVALATAAVPLWMHLSVMDECRSRVERALAALGAEPNRDISRRRKLYAALATSLTYIRGQVPETVEASRNALVAAEKLDDTEHRLHALYGLWNAHAASGDIAAAMDFARRFHRLAMERSHATDVLMGDRMLGSILHFSGEQAAARHHFETMLDGYVPPAHRTATMRHQFDQRIVARALLARVCWMQGFPDQAASFSAIAVENALATNHANAVCYSLVEGACPVAFFTRDFELAKRLVLQLLDRSARYGLTTWHILGRGLEAELLIRCGDTAIGLPRLRTVLEEVNERRLLLRFPALLGVLAEACALAGRVSEAAGAVEQAIVASERTGVRWCLPELLRIKGEVALLDADGSGRSRAEEAFNQALELGRHQGALSWQLRAALSLARLWIQERRSREAHELVRAIYEGFTEGFRTGDLLEARALIHSAGL